MSVKLRSFKAGFKKARRNAKDKNGKRYTQESFAEAFGVSVDTIKNWEQGRFTPNIDTLIELCDFFECDIDYLFGTLKCKTHDKQFIQNETGLSEKAIDELHYLAVLNDALASEPDLNTINTLLEQLSSQYNNIIHAITGYLRSNGLSKDTWYDIRSETLSPKKPPMGTDRVHIPAHSDIFDNLLLMDIQKRIVNLKTDLKKAPDTN